MASTGRIDLIYRSTDSSFYHAVWNGQSFTSSWYTIGGTFIYEPVTLLWGPDLVYVFGVGFDSIIYYKSLHKVTGRWSDKWLELKAVRAPADDLFTRRSPKEPLRWAAKPAVVSLYPKSMEVIGLGSDRTLYHSSWKAGDGWSSFSPLPDKHFREPPSVVSWGSGRFDVFAVGLDGNLYHRWWVKKQGWLPNVTIASSSRSTSLASLSDSSWEDTPKGRGREQGEQAKSPRQESLNWENLQGIFVNTPSAVTWVKGKIDLVGIDVKGKVYHQIWDEDGDAGNRKWTEIGMTSGLVGKVEMVSWGSNRLDVFVIGSDRAIHHRWLNKSSANKWEPAGADETIKGEAAWDQLAATSMSKDHLSVFHIGKNSNVYVKSWTAKGGWVPAVNAVHTALGGCALTRVAACAAQDAMFNP